MVRNQVRRKMKVQLLQALRQHAEGQIAKHKANVDVYLNNTTGIGEHSESTSTTNNTTNSDIRSSPPQAAAPQSPAQSSTYAQQYQEILKYQKHQVMENQL